MIGARVLRRMSFSARFAASANYATTPLTSSTRQTYERRLEDWNQAAAMTGGYPTNGMASGCAITSELLLCVIWIAPRPRRP